MAVGVGKVHASCHLLVAPSGHLRKPAKSSGNCGGSPRSSWLIRLKCTCFCAGPLSKYTAVDSRDVWEE